MSNNIIPLSKETAEIALNALRQWDKSQQQDTPLTAAIGEIERLLENPINLEEWAVVEKRVNSNQEDAGFHYGCGISRDDCDWLWGLFVDNSETHQALKGGDDA